MGNGNDTISFKGRRACKPLEGARAGEFVEATRAPKLLKVRRALASHKSNFQCPFTKNEIYSLNCIRAFKS